ncbi:MAG: DUF2330 domain-containing protein, partial [Deltaproteobacteria bacterium]|nr:DUF2330 domain-containing protein [Deltaproteobacteria bacterium]
MPRSSRVRHVRRLFRQHWIAHALTALAITALSALPAHAFCGFYIGKSDAKLTNETSQVAIAREGDRTVLTMSSDYKGALSDFAMVVPVPTVLEREQIHIGDKRLLDRLDAFSKPRLVEYYDPDPCPKERPRAMYEAKSMAADMAPPPAAAQPKMKQALGVTVEASYTVGEYDIVLLSATQSDGLAVWLSENGYKMPPRTEQAVRPYVKQDMKFFVAKVNLKEMAKAGTQSLRPIQIAFESPKFMLPIRLGMANAEGPQDMTVFMLTQHGRVESSNYRTVKMPSDATLPEYIQDQFPTVYKAMFDHAWHGADERAVLTEYFWNMSWCDP